MKKWLGRLARLFAPLILVAVAIVIFHVSMYDTDISCSHGRVEVIDSEYGDPWYRIHVRSEDNVYVSGYRWAHLRIDEGDYDTLGFKSFDDGPYPDFVFYGPTPNDNDNGHLCHVQTSRDIDKGGQSIMQFVRSFSVYWRT